MRSYSFLNTSHSISNHINVIIEKSNANIYILNILDDSFHKMGQLYFKRIKEEGKYLMFIELII